MKKMRYFYNPKTLNYEKVEVTWVSKAWQAIGWLSTAVIFAAVIVVIYSTYFESPRERQLSRELEKMELEYELMSQELDHMNSVLAELQERDDNIYRVIFEADPIPATQREAGFGGINYFKRFEGYENSKLMSEVEKKIRQLKGKLVVQSKSYDELANIIKNKEDMLAAIPAIQPVSNKDLKRLASGYGYRTHPIYKSIKFHKGLDFTAKRGTEVYATGDGVVVRADKRRSGYGRQIVIDHGYGYKTRYAHLDKFVVKTGQKVKRGELIGYVGNTGLSTAPHLHYEVLKNNRPVNPVNFFFNDLTPQEYEALIEIANTTNQSFD